MGDGEFIQIILITCCIHYRIYLQPRDVSSDQTDPVFQRCVWCSQWVDRSTVASVVALPVAMG